MSKDIRDRMKKELEDAFNGYTRVLPGNNSPNWKYYSKTKEMALVIQAYMAIEELEAKEMRTNRNASARVVTRQQTKGK